LCSEKGCLLRQHLSKKWSQDAVICIGFFDKEKNMSVYKVIELVGTSDKSWEDAAKQAIDMANKSLRDLRIAEISKMDVRLDEGEIVEYRVRVNVSFKYED
jgi:flavin-binding protein dodecin